MSCFNPDSLKLPNFRSTTGEFGRVELGLEFGINFSNKIFGV